MSTAFTLYVVIATLVIMCLWLMSQYANIRSRLNDAEAKVILWKWAYNRAKRSRTQTEIDQLDLTITSLIKE